MRISNNTMCWGDEKKVCNKTAIHESNKPVNPAFEKQMTDKELVASILHGNTRTFEQVIQNTEHLVAQIVFKMIPVAEDRKDVVQDIYLKTYHHLPGFKHDAKLSTWVAQIAYNTCLNYLRKKKPVLLSDLPHETTGAENEETSTAHAWMSENPGGEETLFKKELAAILRTEIDRLPPVYKTLITLFHNENMRYEEITQIVQLPEGTVKSYLYRARKALKEGLLLHYKKDEL